MRKKFLAFTAIAVVTALAGGAVLAASDDHGPGAFGPRFMQGMGAHMPGGGPEGMHAGNGPGMAMRGANGPGAMMGPMHGGDATASEMQGIHDLFANHEQIKRTVTDLPNGIRTVTESDDPQVAQTLKDHVATMMQRVGEQRDPGLPIESPALHAIFDNYDKLETTIETTDKGIVVTQTSGDAATVTALQKHAGEVTAFVEKGMQAVHEAMANNGNMPMAMAQRGMMGQMNMRSMMDMQHGDGATGMPPMMQGRGPGAANPLSGTTR